jgi:uncharacterized delta-60 repeat protein/uncharacterized repeat protein (TIGR01451 family)
MRRLRTISTIRACFGAVIGIAGFGLAASIGLAQPLNDNFANAADLGNATSGIIITNNFAATREAGEPLISGNPGGASVWFKWKAPANITITFNTFNSEINTLLGVYTGTSVDQLTLVAQNDDFGAVSQSSVTFSAVSGTTYMISVDGYDQPPVDEGNITLNWGTAGGGPGSLAGGDFKFTTPYYVVGQNESVAPKGGPDEVANSTQARLTVTRFNGSRGRVWVDYTVTNGFYTNQTISLAVTTNMNTIASDTNGNMLGFTNIFLLASYNLELDQNNEYGLFVSYPIYNLSETFITFTNYNNQLTNSTFVTTNIFTNVIDVTCLPLMTNIIVTNGNEIDVTALAVLCDFTNFTFTVPAATVGYDYIAQSGRLIFDDYQMAKDIFVEMPVPPQGGDYIHHSALPGLAPQAPNRVLIATITNVQFDPLEPTNVLSPPTASTVFTNALVNILDQCVLPLNSWEGTNVFNFERAVVRCSEGVGTANVAVTRVTWDYKATTCPYTIDHNFGNGVDNDWNVFRSARNGQNPGEGGPGDQDIELQAGSDYAIPFGNTHFGDPADFFPVAGDLSWPDNDPRPKFIRIPVSNDTLVEFNEDLLLQLYFPNPPPQPTEKALGWLNRAILTIMFDDQPAGAVDRNHLPDNDPGTSPPYNLVPGANSTVYALAVQADGKTIIGGDFTAFNTFPLNRLARLNGDGSRDTAYNPGDGADAVVTTMLLDPNNKLLVGGYFTSINRNARHGIARLNSDGSLDTGFQVGLGVDTAVETLAIQTNGNILIAGEFSSYNSQPRTRIARLFPNGQLDPTFDPGSGPDGTVWSMTLQPDGKILIAGSFGSVAGFPCGHIARLNPDGTVDTAFNPGTGTDGIIYSIVLQQDGNILAGGSFGSVQGQSRNGIVRFSPNGLLDASFDPSLGFDDTVYTVTLQQDGNILAGGIFTSYNETRRLGIARIFPNGVLDTSFMDSAYNQFAGLPSSYYSQDAEPHHFVYAMGIQPDGNIMIGGGFTRVGGGFTRDDTRSRFNVARLIGGATPGPGNIQFAQSFYSADQNTTNAFISLVRTNGNLGLASAHMSAVALQPGPGDAIDGVDYIFDAGTYGKPTWISSWSRTWQIADGTFGQNQGNSQTIDPNFSFGYPNNDVYIRILNSTNTGNRNLNLALNQPNGDDLTILGGENIALGVALGTRAAPMTIVDNHTYPGTLGFSASTYRVNESTNAVITVTRTNGSAGLVTVHFATANGTATNGIHYKANSGLLTFPPNVTTQTFTVTNIDESITEQDHTVLLSLFTPGGTPPATLGLTNATIIITDNDFAGGYAQFDSATYGTNENAGYAMVTVGRYGGSANTLSVTFTATNGTAVNGTNYIGVSTNLLWNGGDVTPRVIPIKILDDGIVNASNLIISNRLFNPTNNGSFRAQALGATSNSVVVITNSDFRGTLGFTATSYSVNENGGPGIVTVVRSGGSAESISINFAAIPGTATPSDFTPTNGVLVFAPGDLAKSFTVPIIDNFNVDPPRFVTLMLSNATPSNVLGAPIAAILNIVDDESFNQPPGDGDTSVDGNLGFDNDVLALALQPDGKLLVGGSFTNANGFSRRRIARLNPDLSLDTHFTSASPTAGADNSVFTIAAQTDQRILIGGLFTSFNSVNRNYLARLTLDGSIDTTFNPGAGPNGAVNAVLETFTSGGDRKLVIGGAFTLMNATLLNYIARLNNDGSVDGTFNPGQGADAPVFALAVQPDGKLLVGGDFVNFNNVPHNHIVRLNVDGSLDATFNVGAGADGSIRTIVVQSDGRILIGGLFSHVNGLNFNHIARLNPNGSVDTNFNVAPGANDVVTSMALQPDNRIMVGGQFTLANGVTRGRITRLNSDGTADPMINFGLGCNGMVASVLVQTNGMIVFGGGFTTYDGQPHARLARIYGGTVSGSGEFEFDSPNYVVPENGTNVTVTIRRRGGTSGAPSGNVFITMIATNGTAVQGVNYFPLVTNVAFPPGEVLKQVSITVTQDFAITPDLTVDMSLIDPEPQPLSGGGPVLGNQPVAELTIVNVDAALSLSSPTYFRNEDAPDGLATIPILRSGSTVGSASVVFFTTTNGTALAGTNYIPTSNVVNFAQGQTSAIAQIPVIHDPTAQGNKTVTMVLSNAVGALLLSPFAATLTIVDVERLPGQFMFGQTNYVVNEGAGALPVTIVRTNGQSGAVSVGFRTVPGTATPGVKYVTTNGVLSFADGQTNQTFTVPIIDNNIADGNLSFSLVISNATGGANIIGPTNVPVTIIDNETGFLFASPAYVIPETGGAVSLTVLRQGATNGSSSIQYATTNALVITTNIVGGVTNVSTNLGAIAGINYVGITNTLNFTNGETIKSFSVQVLHDTNVTGDLPFNVNLFNPQAPAQLVSPSSATVVVLDSEAGFFFTNSVFGTLKSATNIVVTVVRSNANTGLVTVGYATSDGTATNGIDYNGVSGALTFSNGVAFQSFSVPLINNKIVQSDRYFNVFLTNAAPTNIASVLSPSTAQVFITNDVSGISYSAGFYSVNENGVAAPITIVRSGYLNNNVSVSYNTADGTAVGGVNYLPTGGAVLFTNGETTKTFSVQVIDDGVVTADNTVLLSLTAPQGNAVLVSPSAAVLDIHEVDGSFVLPAGSTLIGESGPVNGLYDSNETVTVLMALRNASGNNTTNLVATLLTTNGVSNPSGPQNYGALLSHGPSAFRPFTFKVTGTNGQPVQAVLALQDGASVLANAVFTFQIGNVPTSYSNNAAIVINDFTNATPYPSVINVSSLNGAVTKATVTVSNVYHTWPSDIDMLLVSPAGQKSYLMAKCGGGNVINRVSLTFDDLAATSLTSSTIVSGTNKPTSLAASTPAFPVPAPPGPYNTNLSVFNGGNPNGAWSLYVIDDSHVNTGIVSNGWTLSLNTASASPADLGLAMTASAPSVITGSNITFNITLTNYGPSTASNVVISDTLPVGAVVVSASGGGSTNTPGLVTWTLGTPLVTNAWTNFSVTMSISIAGSATNAVAFTAGTSDPNPDDDAAVAVVNVVSPTADLVLSMSGTPNPVLLGNYVTYSLTVSNSGPATALVVGLTNTLSPSVAFTSASPAGYGRSGNLVTFTNLGTLPAGAATNVSIVVQPRSAGTITNNAQCASSVTDPAKANNLASVKTVVEQMTIARSGTNVIILWPSDVGSYSLYGATNLKAPVAWTLVTNTTISVAGMNQVTVPIGPGARYFRLRTP